MADVCGIKVDMLRALNFKVLLPFIKTGLNLQCHNFLLSSATSACRLHQHHYGILTCLQTDEQVTGSKFTAAFWDIFGRLSQTCLMTVQISDDDFKRRFRDMVPRGDVVSGSP